MTRKKIVVRAFDTLTRTDLDDWAGDKVARRGKKYQRQGRVTDLAIANGGSLIAWVDGTERYATKVDIGADGAPESICTCPYGRECKHGVAAVLEYLDRVKSGKPVPQAQPEDDRLGMLEEIEPFDGVDEDDARQPESTSVDVGPFLEKKTRAQLIELISELAKRFPEVRHDLTERHQIASGNIKAIASSLRRMIRQVTGEFAWYDSRSGQGFTPDYSPIRRRLEMLVENGFADEAFDLAREFVSAAIRQAEESGDDGESRAEFVECMPVIVETLDKSSAQGAEKLAWAVETALGDEYDLFEMLVEYLDQQHDKRDWSRVADHLLDRLRATQSDSLEDHYDKYERDRLTDWVVHALEESGRTDEIIPLCQAEAHRTGSYVRLVELLIADQRSDHAELWIHRGILATEEKYPGIASMLRDKLCEIRVAQEDWSAATAIQVEEFVRNPSLRGYSDCREAAERDEIWPDVRECVLAYLERGVLPWNQDSWPYPETTPDAPPANRTHQFPIVDTLIEIALEEKQPQQVLRWHEYLLKQPQRLLLPGDEEIAEAIQGIAPDRATAIWKRLAEDSITGGKFHHYEAAQDYLRKARTLMVKHGMADEWAEYEQGLRQKHRRKRRLGEILDRLDDEVTSHPGQED